MYLFECMYVRLLITDPVLKHFLIFASVTKDGKFWDIPAKFLNPLLLSYIDIKE